MWGMECSIDISYKKVKKQSMWMQTIKKKCEV